MPARELVGPAAALLLLGLGLQGLHRDPALGLHAVGVQVAAAGAGGRVSVELFHRVGARLRSEEHTSELQSHLNLVCRLLLEKKKKNQNNNLNRNQKKKYRR